MSNNLDEDIKNSEGNKYLSYETKVRCKIHTHMQLEVEKLYLLRHYCSSGP